MIDTVIDVSILCGSYFIQLYCYSIIIEILFKANFTTKQKLLFATIQSGISVIFKYIIPIDLNYIGFLETLIATTLSSYLILKLSLKNAILSTLLFVLISVPVEIISGFIGFKIVDISSTTSNVQELLPIYCLICLWFIFITIILSVIKNKRKLFNISSLKGKLIVINSTLAIILIIGNLFMYTYNRYSYPLYVSLFNIFLNLSIIGIGIYNTYQNSKLEVKEMELKNAELHNANLKALIDNVRIFKHDYANIMNSIGGYIELNDMDGLKNYFPKIFKECQKVNNIESISPTKINEPSIYGIIASKYQVADLNGITFNFESMFDYTKLKLPTYDFCKILGILLDNAIEAADESPEKVINICIRENIKKHEQIIQIQNSYKNKDVDLNKIFEKDYSTKGRNSGIGLWEVNNILSRNKNVTLFTTKDNKYFNQQLNIHTN